MLNKVVVPKGGWFVNQITLYGISGDTALPADTTAFLMLAHSPDMTMFDGSIYTGQQVFSTRYTGNAHRQDLVFNFSSPLYLAEGTYWLTGYSGHAYSNGGWWFQRTHDVSASDVGYYHNPWGGEGDSFGTRSVTVPEALRAWGGKSVPNLDGALQIVGTVPQGRILHVSVGGTGDGSSWSSPLGDVVAAVNSAHIGDQVWVAAGNYTVAGGTWVSPGVRLYGGFVGNEPDNYDVTQRNLNANRTILSNNPGDYTVIGVWGYEKQFPQDTSQVIDGFTTKGTGMGIAAFNCSPTISNNQVVGQTGNWPGGINIGNSDGAVITNNLIDSNVGVGDGGGIGIFSCAVNWGVGAWNWNGNPYVVARFKPTKVSLSGNTITNNTGRFGGGVEVWYSHLAITNNLIKGNTARESGGGISIANTDALIDNNVISGNVAAVSSSDSIAGGILSSNWDGNPYYRGQSTITNNTITDNSSLNRGGGVIVWGQQATIQRNYIAHNTSYMGSAIWAGRETEVSLIDISNNLIVNSVGVPGWNGPDDKGYTVAIVAGITNLANNTMVGNTGHSLMYLDGSVGLYNNIFSNNMLDVSLAEGNFHGVSEDYNLIFNNGATNYYGDSTVLIPGTNDLWADPVLDSLYQPANYSPVINAGDNYVVDTHGKDYLGMKRVVAGRVDIGAIEVQKPGADITLTIPNVTGAYGITKPLVAKMIRNSDKLPVAGQKVYFVLGSTTIGSATTDANGKATLNYKLIFNVGAYPLAVVYRGTPQYNKASGNGVLTIIPADTSITIAKVAGSYGQTKVLSAVLTRKTDGTKLANQTLTFMIDGNTIGTVNTDSTGKATLNYIIDEGLTPGVHSWSVSYAGAMNDNPSTATATLTVNPAATSLALAKASGKAGATVNLTATLKRSTDKMLLAGKTITFSVDGVAVGTATTDSNGVAVLAYTIDSMATKGVHPASATFGGDTMYLTSTANSTLTVK